MKNGPLALILLASLVAAASGCHKAQPDTRTATGTEEHFSLLLEHSPAGWAAHCESGCSWKDLTMPCTNCKVKVDADGIVGVHNGLVQTTSRGFAFVLDDSNGLSAHALQGTRWRDLSWGCATAVCHRQLNEQGVHVPA